MKGRIRNICATNNQDYHILGSRTEGNFSERSYYKTFRTEDFKKVEEISKLTGQKEHGKKERKQTNLLNIR